MPFAIALAAMLIARRVGGRAALARQVTEPSCAACGYCVRGLETFICPECGSNLHDVGILMPGEVKPLTQRMRLLVWTCAAPAPALLCGMFFVQTFGPFQLMSAQQRFIFSQLPTLNATITAQTNSSQLNFRRFVPNKPLPPQWLTLTLQSQNSPNVLRVDLRDKSYTFSAADGNKITSPGPFDAKAIAAWLYAHGFHSSDLQSVADDVKTAVDQMVSGTGGGFWYARRLPTAWGVTAHPVTTIGMAFRALPIDRFLPYALAIIVWLIGLPFVNRPRRVESTPTTFRV